MIDFNELINALKGDGVTRNLDELARIVIPSNFRNGVFFGGTEVYLFKVDKYVVISKRNYNGEGIKKVFDELGRIQINAEVRRDLEWKAKDSISVWKIDDYIILKKVESKCVFCGNNADLTNYKEKYICKECKKNISKA